MRILLLFFVLMTSSVYSQVDEKTLVNDWLAQNPGFKLHSTIEYQGLSDIDKAALSQMENHIIYDGGLKISDIEAYENAVDKLAPRTDEEYVFNWQLNNPSVKVIKHSLFIELTSEKQLIYKNTGAMILLGEEITKADINLYEN